MKEITRIIIAFILFLIGFIIPIKDIWIQNTIYLVSYLLVGTEIIIKAVKNIFKGNLFDENSLMTIATLGALAIGEFPEAVAVMLFYQIGETLQDYAVDESKKAITNAMNIRPDFARVERNGKQEELSPEKVEIGEIIIVKPGEKVPLDGIILDGNSMVDTSSLTGESVPVRKEKDEEILSGCINQTGVLTIKVTKKYEESTVNKILNLVENASSKKSKSEKFITKFAKIYTPIVVGIAILLAIIPPFIMKVGNFTEWLYRALTFLVVSCPCALVISIPLGFFGGIGGASKKGILIKGGNYLEQLSNAEMMVFDKTGTITEGVFEVQKIEINNKQTEFSKEELLRLSAYSEYNSNHPVAVSIKKAYKGNIDSNLVTKTEELSGLGIIATVEGKEICIGNEKLMREKQISYVKYKETGTILNVAVDNKWIGYIVISDKIKKDAKQTIKDLKDNKIKKTVMLTGDKEDVGEKVAHEIEVDEVYTELLPDEKVKKLEELMKQKSHKGRVIFVGDGINDAPVLAISDVGIAMGALGSDAAVEASDIVIMTDELSKILESIKISRKTMKIVKQNIVFAIAVKIIVLILSALGLSTMWGAVFADVGVSIIAIMNSLRTLK